jgi:hypothetical protein
MMKVRGFSDTDKSHVYKVLADIVPERRYKYLAECLKHSRERREPYYYLAEFYVEKEVWGLAKMYVEMALRHTKSSFDIFNNPKVWNGAVEELQAKIEQWYNDNEQRIDE